MYSWFIVECIHFALGAIGCLFQPSYVVSSYCMNPRAPASAQTLEMVSILGAFYVGNSFLSAIAIRNVEVSHWLSLQLAIFYLVCFLFDLKGIVEKKIVNYPGYRWMDTAIHVIFGVLNFAFFFNCLGSDRCY
jgi:hypothetical protein